MVTYLTTMPLLYTGTRILENLKPEMMIVAQLLRRRYEKRISHFGDKLDRLPLMRGRLNTSKKRMNNLYPE